MKKNNESKNVLKTVIKKVPDENVYSCPFVDEYYATETTAKQLIVCGNRNFSEYGDKTLIAVVKGDYCDEDNKPGTDEPIEYDYDKLEELKKLTGKDWEEVTFRGYSQGDWQTAYYVPSEITQERLKLFEAYYMGKYNEYQVFEDVDPENFDEDDWSNTAYVPHEVAWNGKKSICEFLGVNVDDTVVLEDDGYEKVYRYKEVE